MNGKKAKLLRKLVGYIKKEHPAQYVHGRVKTILEPESARAKYQVLKQAVKSDAVKIERKAV